MGNFHGWKFLRFHDTMYHANISQFLSSRLEVITMKIALPRVKNFTCKLNFAKFNFAVRPQPRKPRKFVDRENFPSYGIHSSNIVALDVAYSCFQDRIVAKNMVVLEWRPTGHICLKISPALLGVWIVSQGETDCCMHLAGPFSLIEVLIGNSLYNPNFAMRLY